jgi:hypothetical protein
VVTAALAVNYRMEGSVKLTDTQLVLLSAASQRDDRALERPSSLTGGAAGKVVAKLLTEGLVEEVQSRGSFPIWRREQRPVRWPTETGSSLAVRSTRGPGARLQK